METKISSNGAVHPKPSPGGSWGPPMPNTVGEGLEEGHEKPEQQKKATFAAICTVLISVPSLVGTWCWPILVGWMMHIAWYNIDKKLDQMSYALEALIIGVMVTNIFQFGWWRAKAECQGNRSHWENWGGVWLLAVSVPLQMAMPVAVVLIYIGGVNYPASKMWYGGSWAPNAPHGIALFVMKYLGVACFTVGVVKVTHLFTKIRHKWQSLRG